MSKDGSSTWIMGAYGNGNVGDDMLADLVRRTLESAAIRPKVFAGEFFPFYRDADHGRRSVIRNVRRGDNLLIAGGGLLNDHFGHGFLKLFASLAVALRLKGARYSFVGIGVEGFTTKVGAFLARIALSLATSVSVRDSPSKSNVAAIGRTATSIPDIGWLARRHLPKASGEVRPIVMLSIAVEHEAMRHQREEVLRAAAKEVLRQTDKDIVLVAMQASSVPALDDSTSMDSIRESLGSERVSVFHPRSYLDLYPVLQRTSVVGGFRLHAAVLGAVAGCRVVSVSRSHKVREALAGLSQCHVTDESHLGTNGTASLGAQIVDACKLPPVAESDLQILDDFCGVLESKLIGEAGARP